MALHTLEWISAPNGNGSKKMFLNGGKSFASSIN
jgi:hypothetical protein